MDLSTPPLTLRELQKLCGDGHCVRAEDYPGAQALLTPRQFRRALEALRERCLQIPFYAQRLKEGGETYLRDSLATMPLAFIPACEVRYFRVEFEGLDSAKWVQVSGPPIDPAEMLPHD